MLLHLNTSHVSNRINYRCVSTFLKTINQKEEQINQQVLEEKVKPADWYSAKPYSRIPGPKPVPIFGNLWRFLPIVGEYYGLHQLDLHKKFVKNYGNIVKISDIKLKKDFVILFDPNDIEICYRNEGIWPRREGIGSVSYYRQHVRNDVYKNQNGVFASHGENWYYARKVINPSMMQPRNVHKYIGTINEVTQDFLDRIRFLEKAHPLGEMPKNFSTEITQWTLESVCTIALNKRLGLLNYDKDISPETKQFVNDTTTVFDVIYELDVKPSLWKWFSTPVWKKFVKMSDRLLDFEVKCMNQVIDQLSKQPDDKSFSEMSILEQLLKKDKKVALATISDLLIAGIDTTTKSISAALYYLSTNIEAQEKLRKECREVLPRKDSTITKEILNNMPYLRAVIKEATRLAPIAIGVLRRTPKDMVLSGYQIPKGMALLNSHMYLCRQDKYFPRANEFIPDRWLRDGSNDLQSKDAHPFIYMPFGFGPRSCIGKRIVQMQMEVLLAKIFRNFSFSWPHEEMEWEMKLFYGTKSPLKYHIKSLED